MSGRLLSRGSRLAAAAALIIASGAVSAVAAVPASAATGNGSPGCSVSSGYALLTGPSRISAHYTITCEDRTAAAPISIARLVNGTWQSVATGNGALIYICQGSTEYEYVVEVAANYEFEDACG
jgi:hypothetical protein